ncbi:MAG: MgtC/SapB family protein [Gammaproteobacteria bacterium]|nr:MgtC/SapB family protein [Gammaproteobacteria bacterium]
MLDPDHVTVLSRLLLAMLAGGIIGFERTYHGRPAGFRTHTLVCCSSSLLMLLTVFQWQLIEAAHMDTIRVDPTRMAQGIMTGIGFLGAGVIMKEKLAVRGLTTAASIWMTASIGIVIGMGFFFAAAAASVITLGTLTLFNRIESKMPIVNYGKLTIRMPRDNYLNETEIYEIINAHSINSFTPSFTLNSDGKMFEYQMTISTKKTINFSELATALSKQEKIHEFSVIPVGT